MREGHLLAPLVGRLLRTPLTHHHGRPFDAVFFTRFEASIFAREFGSRTFSFSTCQLRLDHQETAKSLNQKGLDEQESQIENGISEEKEKQVRTPWHREGSNVPPVKRLRSAGAMTKGRRTFCPASA